ncbi:hypothetical protein [Candidatus Marithrix sp. Canyon 246]|uniref:hypothetical protein n=1 Tax=Candidatus Marithrix sp. Canyon 246 TaxID=1827136 RepID=UPI00084A1416|nr:hypothetical protein [Candidatus Marithrix sp. Canyon 246]
MTKKVSIRNTKTEIIEAYQDLETAYKDLQKKKIPKNTTTPPKATPPVAMTTVIQSLGQLSKQFNTALSQLSSNLLIEASQLTEVSTKVETENRHLETLYDLKITDQSLNDLLKQYTENAEQYQQTLQQQGETSEKAWTEKNQTWQTEIEATKQHLKEEEAAYHKHQHRNEQEYKYDLSLQRDTSEEKYQKQQQQLQQVIAEAEQQRQQVWKQRETALAERERQFKDNQTKVETFPKDLEAAIKKAKDQGIGIARNQTKIKTDLAAKEFAGEEQIYQLQIQALETQAAEQTTQLNKLSKQLEATQKQAQELAVKAIEGASSQTSFHALKEIALEQAKNHPKAK